MAITRKTNSNDIAVEHFQLSVLELLHKRNQVLQPSHSIMLS